ncbi:cytochrome P450 [Gigaspora rosea]|uniref:Cytochrome P450 n=1 Tax=Gigaspora rosea TaxID=44941 RepID=A0A397UIM2_9GLOM|nr:cytochrome P450 [Gigaspora rosea]
MGIITSVGIILFLYFTYYYYSYFTRPNPLPGPFPLPFIGTLLQIGLEPHKWAEKNLNDSIDIWEFYAGPFRVIVPCDAKYVDKIYLSYNESKGLSKEAMFSKRGVAIYDEVGIQNGVVFNNDFHKWKRSRQFITKVLMSKKHHIEFINSSQKIFKEFEKEWGNNDVITIDFSKWISLYKAKVTIATVIGQPLYNLPSFDSVSRSAAEYVAMYAFLIFVPKIIINIFKFFGFNTIKKESVFLNGTIRSIIQKRRDKIMSESTPNFNLLDLLLIANSSSNSEGYIEGEQPMNDEEIETNLAEITAASIETTSNALCFLVYNVAKNPLNHEKICAEIFEIFGSDINSMVTYEALEKCRYVDALVKETLRNINPVPYNLRVLYVDDSTDKFHWSSGTWFLIDNQRIMNNPKYWKEPMKFDPSRFLSEEHGGTDEFSNMCKNGYVPFGGGLRICPGRNLALIELKLLAILFFRKYNIELVNNESIKYVYRTTNQVHDFMIKISQKRK